MDFDFAEVLLQVMERNASDLHLTAGSPPMIPHDMPKLGTLGLPPVLEDFTKKPRGFVLVTGPTGSGKSTSLAAMLDLINDTRQEHILTIEDPIEFLHRHKKCIVNQRELGADSQS